MRQVDVPAMIAKRDDMSVSMLPILPPIIPINKYAPLNLTIDHTSLIYILLIYISPDPTYTDPDPLHGHLLKR